MHRRVVITGLGVISPCGTGKEDFWKNIKSGKSGIGKITRFDTSDFPTKVAGEVKDFEAKWYMDPKAVLRTDLATHYAVNAACMAAEDAGVYHNGIDSERFGVSVGTTLGGLIFALEQHGILLEKGAARMNPFTASAAFPNATSSQISIHLKAKGPSYTISNACTSSFDAIGFATYLIRSGMMDVMVAGGADAPLYPTIFSAFCLSRIMSQRTGGTPKPFDINRDGMILSEGAGMLILEDLGHAIHRNAKIYGEILGYASACDAYHMVAYDPTGNGAFRAVKGALADAKILPDEIEYIQAYANATLVNDIAETIIIKKVFDDYAYKIPITSLKSLFGHVQSASGAIELIGSLGAMDDGVIPPTINYETPDPDCNLNYVFNTSKKTKFRLMLANCFGFGGKNSALVLKKFEDSVIYTIFFEMLKILTPVLHNT
ncbi:MAG: beta-ketoacyl-ACP synthase II [bacterium]|nr:beta-ketoacyl-ACP synthase II [bacterium]